MQTVGRIPKIWWRNALLTIALGYLALRFQAAQNKEAALTALGAIISLWMHSGRTRVKPGGDSLASTIPIVCLAALAFGACDVPAGDYTLKSARVEKGQALSGSVTDYVQLTVKAASPLASGFPGIYAKSSDNLLRFVDGSGVELKAGEANLAQNLAADPSGATGKIYYNTISNTFRIYDGSWSAAPTSATACMLAGTQTITGVKTFNAAPVFGAGLTATGSSPNDFSGSSGAFKTSTGNVTVGPGDVTVSGKIAGDIALLKETAHVIKPGASTTATTAGASLSIASGAGNGAAGGTLDLDSGTGTTGGAVNLGLTYAESVNLGRTGKNVSALGPLLATLGVWISGAPTVSTFYKVCTIASAAAATPVNCLSAADVPPTLSAKLGAWRAYVNGSTSWSTVTSCVIEDTAGNDFISIAVAALAGDTVITDSSSNVTKEVRYRIGTGGATDAGLQVSCNSNGTGSDLVFVMMGTIQ